MALKLLRFRLTSYVEKDTSSVTLAPRRNVNLLAPTAEAAGADTDESPHEQRQPTADHDD